MSKWRSGGFTLVELLVVISIIGILVSLTLPAVQRARETARKMSCSNNMKQIGLAIHHYHATYQTFPPSSTSDVEQGGWLYYPQRRHIHSWSSLILPFLELSNVANNIDYSESSLHPNNLPVATSVIPIYRCPTYSGPEFSADPDYTRFSHRYAIGNYVAMGASDVGHIYGQNTGLFEPDGTIYPLSETRAADVSDGLSNTVLIVETREGKLSVWIDGGTAAVVALRYDSLNSPTYAGLEHALNYAPYFPYIHPNCEYGPSSMHPSGAQHLLGDGSVRFITDYVAA